MNCCYFLVYPRGDMSYIAVVDLQSDLLYEKNDWKCVNNDVFISRNEAISTARDLSCRFNLKYQMFESRYDDASNEFLGEFE